MNLLRYLGQHSIKIFVFVLCCNSLVAESRRIVIDQPEVDALLEADQNYVYIGAEVSNCARIIQRVALLVQEHDTVAALQNIVSRLEKNYYIAPKELVLQALQEACDIVEKNHAWMQDDAELIALIDGIEKCCNMIVNDELRLYRSPRPAEDCGLETEEFDPEKVCCDFPRDAQFRIVNIGDCDDLGSLTVAGESTFRGDIILQPCVGNQFCIFFREDDGFEKIRVCTSPVEDEKGLRFSVDGGVTQHVRIEDDGDLALELNLDMVHTDNSIKGIIYKNADTFLHDSGSGNVFLGSNAGTVGSVIAGGGNIGIGDSACTNVTAGLFATAVGAQSFLNSTDLGAFNTAVGGVTLRDCAGSTENTAIGYNSSRNNTTGSFNAAVGNSSLRDNTSGSSNVAVGSGSLRSNTASFNTAVGVSSMLDNTTGTENTGIGSFALFENTTGSFNTALGSSSLLSNTTGIRNTAAGQSALRANTAGSNNVAMGYNNALSNTTGTQNVSVGASAFSSNTTGNFNTVMGFNAAVNNTTGSENVAIGQRALLSNTTSSRNVAVGTRALEDNTSGRDNVAIGFGSMADNTSGIDNTAVGTFALDTNTSGNFNTALGFGCMTDNTTGSENVAVGAFTFGNNTTGILNVAVGVVAMDANTTGSFNVAVGRSSARNNTTGGRNTAIGAFSLHNNSVGEFNTALGINAAHDNTTGGFNVAVGNESLFSNLTGSNNTALGNMAGNLITTGSDNIFLGRDADAAAAADSNEIVIGAGATGNGSDSITIGFMGGVATSTTCFIDGIFGVAGAGNPVEVTGTGQLIDASASSIRFKKNVQDLAIESDAILNLRPVSFDFKGSGDHSYGLIAEEVEQVVPAMVTYDQHDPELIHGVQYKWLPIFLLKVLREQRDEIEAQHDEIEFLKQAVLELQAQHA